MSTGETITLWFITGELIFAAMLEMHHHEVTEKRLRFVVMVIVACICVICWPLLVLSMLRQVCKR